MEHRNPRRMGCSFSLGYALEREARSPISHLVSYFCAKHHLYSRNTGEFGHDHYKINMALSEL